LVDIHPDDAAPRNIGEGDVVTVFNDRGELTLRARVSDRVRSGVVAVPSGWWASASPSGRSANALTADGLSDLGEGGDFHDTLVDVARAPAGVAD
jgi:anaerobic selenocysteine-containing dehydrogenase